MASQPVSVSVIIVTHNSCAAVGDCLRALPAACADLTHEVIIVDNKSGDETVSVIHAADPDARVIQQTRNLGFGAACNIGAQAACGEFLLFVNPDAILDAAAVRRLIDARTDADRTGFVVPRLRYPDGRFQPSCRRLPTIGNILFSRGSVIARIFSGGNRSESARYTLPDYKETTAVDAVAGTVALIRRDLFLSSGGFDTRFFMYMEDTDLCLHLGRRGLKHLFVPSAGAVHCWGSGSATGRTKRIWHHHISFWKYFLKHYPNGFSVVVLPLLLLLNRLSAMVLPDRRMDTKPC